MKPWRNAYVVSLSVVLLVLLVSDATSATSTHTEDFTTTLYEDAVNTTAFWDVIAGELRLPPFPVTAVSTHSTTGSAWAVWVAGSHAFVAADNAGLRIVDISNVSSPTDVGFYDTPGIAYAVAVAGDFAFVADGIAGLRVINVANPVSPAEIDAFDTGGTAYGITVRGDYVYLAGGSTGLHILDVADPSNVMHWGSYDTPGTAYDVAVAGRYAFVADGSSGGLQIVDIANPGTPSLESSIGTVDARAVSIAGNVALIADGSSGLRLVDITDPASPAFLGLYDTPVDARDVFVTGDYAYVADALGGLQVIDITSPTSPQLETGYSPSGAALGVTVTGAHAFVAWGSAGLRVVDVCDPVQPDSVGNFDYPGRALSVDTDGNNGYLVNDFTGLISVDLSDPENPTMQDNLEIFDEPTAVTVWGDVAYVTDFDRPAPMGKFWVIDISDPTSLSSITYRNLSYDWPYGLTVDGNVLCVANSLSGLRVYDITDPSNPVFEGSYVTANEVTDVAIDGNYAYLSVLYQGLTIVDISNASSPTLVATYNTAGEASGIAASGDFAYVADGSSGLIVIDISNPASPFETGAYDPGGFAWNLAIDGDYAFVATGNSGLRAFSIANPTNPYLYGYFDTNDVAYDVSLAGEYAFVADGGNGLVPIRVFQRQFDTTSNIGQSLRISPLGENVKAVKLSATYTDSIRFDMCADRLESWQEIIPNDTWHWLSESADTLKWRTTHVVTDYDVNPTCSNIDIEWIYDMAVIGNVADIPGDQGGWVRSEMTRAANDRVNGNVDGYNIHRRVDDSGLVLRILDEGNPVEVGTPIELPAGESMLAQSASGTSRLVELDGRYYNVNAAGLTCPPEGIWETLLYIAAQQQDHYLALLPTLADSSTVLGYTAYYVSTHTTTPWIHYCSPVDSGYSVDNLAPQIPSGFTVDYNAGSNRLTWDQSTDPDFQYHKVYRGESPSFEPSPGNLAHTTTGTEWLDTVEEAWRYNYKLSTVDVNGNEGDATGPDGVTAISGPPVPEQFALHQNVPNPFNPTTTIGFDLPEQASVKLSIYDVSGRLVSTLVDTDMEPGRKSVRWDGRDAAGGEVASGVYFYRLETQAFNQSRKMILLR